MAGDFREFSPPRARERETRERKKISAWPARRRMRDRVGEETVKENKERMTEKEFGRKKKRSFRYVTYSFKNH